MIFGLFLLILRFGKPTSGTMIITSEEQYHTAQQRFSELDKWVAEVFCLSHWGAQQVEAINEYSDLNTALAMYETSAIEKGGRIVRAF